MKAQSNKPFSGKDIRIWNVYPELRAGRYPIKREVDRPLEVRANIQAPGK